MLPGARLSELFRKTCSAEISAQNQNEFRELLCGYQKYADFHRALDHVRSILISWQTVAVIKQCRGDEILFGDLIRYIDQIVME